MFGIYLDSEENLFAFYPETFNTIINIFFTNEQNLSDMQAFLINNYSLGKLNDECVKKFQYFLDFGQSITINSQTTSNIKDWCIYKMYENENVPNEEKKDNKLKKIVKIKISEIFISNKSYKNHQNIYQKVQPLNQMQASPPLNQMQASQLLNQIYI